MNLTLTQSFHRTQNLSGEIKAAQTALADCEADHAAKERIASIAGEAVETAKANLARLEQEREDLAVHMAGLVRQVGGRPDDVELPREGDSGLNWPKPIPEWARDVPSEQNADLAGASADPFQAFGHPLQNGDDSKVNAAYEQATHP